MAMVEEPAQQRTVERIVEALVNQIAEELVRAYAVAYGWFLSRADFTDVEFALALAVAYCWFLSNRVRQRLQHAINGNPALASSAARLLREAAALSRASTPGEDVVC